LILTYLKILAIDTDLLRQLTKMKTTLKQIPVLRLTLNEKPTSHNNRKLIFDRDSSLPPCIVFDDRWESPIGFGVKIIKTKKTYIIQKRV